jgi:hypothetical protein
MENINTLHLLRKMNVPFLSVELLTYVGENMCVLMAIGTQLKFSNNPCFCVCVCMCVFDCVTPNITLNTKGHDHFRVCLDG